MIPYGTIKGQFVQIRPYSVLIDMGRKSPLSQYGTKQYNFVAKSEMQNNVSFCQLYPPTQSLSERKERGTLCVMLLIVFQ